MPQVIVVSSFYNRANCVDETMLGLIEQDHPDFKAIVIDDGSLDDSYAALCQHASGIIYIRRQENMGFVSTISSVISLTDSQYIAIQGSGDYSYPARLRLQSKYLDDHSDVAAVGCYFEVVSTVSDYRAINRPRIEEDVHAQLIRANPLGHGQVMMRRSIYDAVGGYRPFFIYRQDLDLWFRMSEVGRLAVVPQILYRTYRLPGSVAEDPRKYALAIVCRDFAVHCANERRRGRPDPLDTIGPISALVRPRSVEASRNLAYAARRRAVRGLREDARYLAAASTNEARTVSGIVTQIIIRLPGLVGLRRVIVSLRKFWGMLRGRGRVRVPFSVALESRSDQRSNR